MGRFGHLADGCRYRLFPWFRRAVFVGLFVFCSRGTAVEYWTFTNTAGRKIEARIVTYNAENKTVVLKRKKGGSPAAVPLNMLSAADHEYIDRWAASQNFLDNRLLEIRVDENTTHWEDAGDDEGIRKRKFTSFIIHLTNRNDLRLEGIRAEYCLYRDRRKYIETDNFQVSIGDFEAGERKEVEPRNKHSSFKRSSKFLNEVVGARFRFYMTLNDGSEIMREVCVPEPLSLEEYPWKEGRVAEQEKLKQMPDPTSYPDKEITEQDVKTIAQAYIRTFKDKDLSAWKQLLAPLHPNASELDEDGFNYLAHNLKRLKIEEVAGLNVRVSLTNMNNHSFDEWLQIHPSGYIKYGPCVIRHPVKKAFRSMGYLLAKDVSWRNTGVHALKRADIPLCGYDVNESRVQQVAAIDRILDWLAENGADHDPTEPKVAMPPAQFSKCLRDARRSISNSGHTH